MTSSHSAITRPTSPRSQHKRRSTPDSPETHRLSLVPFRSGPLTWLFVSSPTPLITCAPPSRLPSCRTTFRSVEYRLSCTVAPSNESSWSTVSVYLSHPLYYTPCFRVPRLSSPTLSCPSPPPSTLSYTRHSQRSASFQPGAL